MHISQDYLCRDNINISWSRNARNLIGADLGNANLLRAEIIQIPDDKVCRSHKTFQQSHLDGIGLIFYIPDDFVFP